MDERLTGLERDARRGDTRALSELVAVLERRAPPDEVERRLTEVVDAAALGPAEWIPVVVESFGPDDLRRVRVRAFDGAATGKPKGDEVDELQFDRHGATFGVRPANASALVIDDSDRELVYASDLTPALLLRLLRDPRRLDLDFAEVDDLGDDPFRRDGRFLRECQAVGVALELRDERLVVEAGPLRLILEHEPGPAGARLSSLDLRGRGGEVRQALSPGDALPRRFFTGFDLRRWCDRLAADATREHRSRGDLAAFFDWTVSLGGHEATIEIEPLGRGYGARVVVVDGCWSKYCEEYDGEPHDVRLLGPVRPTPAETLCDLVTGATSDWHTEHVRDDDWQPSGRDDDQ